MSEPLWIVWIDNKQSEPLSLSRLREMSAQGQLPAEMPIRSHPSGPWIKVSDLPELSEPVPVQQTTGLGSCSKCGGKVSDEALVCPHCGEKQPRQMQIEQNLDCGQCENCGTFNLLGPSSRVNDYEMGIFDTPCRGCGTKLSQAYPTAMLGIERDKVTHNIEVVRHSHRFRIASCLALIGCLIFSIHILNWLVGIGGLASLIASGLAIALYVWVDDRIVAWIWATGARSWFWDRSHSTEAIHQRFGRKGYGRWESTWHRVGNTSFVRKARYWDRNGVDTKLDSGVPFKFSFDLDSLIARWLPWVVLGYVWLTLVAGNNPNRKNEQDIEAGKQAGIQQVQKLHSQGTFSKPGMNLTKAREMITSDKSKSENWNKAFEAGFLEELQRLQPDLSKRK